jgi:hypothetical protein
VHRASGSEKIVLAEARGSPMQTECSADLFGFTPVEGRNVVAAFDGGRMTSEAAALLLGAADKQIGLIARFTGCRLPGRRSGRTHSGEPGRAAGIRDRAGAHRAYIALGQGYLNGGIKLLIIAERVNWPHRYFFTITDINKVRSST